MLNYHPVGDSYHCIFRLLLLTHSSNRQELEWDRLRLMDFYFLFPHLLKNLSLPREFFQHKKKFKAIPDPYEEMSSPSRMYFKLAAIQESAVRSIIAKGYYDKELYLSKSLIRKSQPLPTEITRLFELETKHKSDWFEGFLEIFLSTELSSPDGLKSRSGVMEFRYDAT